MLIIPAVDIRGGRCVRLTQGKPDQERVYFDDPVDAARKWVECGAEWLHIVDLDGAIDGQPRNTEVIGRIMREVQIPVQVGGGIRMQQAVERYFNLGVQRVVITTLLFEAPEVLQKLCRRYPGKIAISLDIRNKDISIRGWQENVKKTTEEIIKLIEQMGIATVIYTDITKDGTLGGINLPSVRQFAKMCKLPIIVAGGVSRIEDIKKLKKIKSPPIMGAIVGKGIYEGTLDLKEAIKAAKE